MEACEHREAWNKGKLVGQKAPLKPKDIWAIRIHLQGARNVRDLAMFNLAIDSKLRGCDLVIAYAFETSRTAAGGRECCRSDCKCAERQKSVT